MSIRIEMIGHDKLVAAFNGLADKWQKKLLRPGLRAGAKVIRAAAIREAPRAEDDDKDGKHLADSFKIKALKRDRSKRGRLGYVVISGKRTDLGITGSGYYPAHIEFGYVAGRRSVNSLEVDNLAFLSSLVTGKNRRVIEGVKKRASYMSSLPARQIPANPYMKRALESARTAAMQAISDEIAARMKVMAGFDRDASDEEFAEEAPF